jgi:hypothetical protein
MNINLKNFIKEKFLNKGIFIKRATNEVDLERFFSMINPVQTNKSLIRVGDHSDGGYLIPDDLEGIKACFSPGVSCEASFELDLANRNIKSYLADYSVNSTPIQNDLFDFEKKYLGSEMSDMFMTLDSWIRRKEPAASDFILQMDIEGSEYSSILGASEDILQRFRIITIEIHNIESWGSAIFLIYL